MSGELPVSVAGSHFGPTLRSDMLSQHYQQHVPQRLILKQLWEWGVEISAGQLNRLLIDGHEQFHEEKAEVLRIGLDVSSPINVDDTGPVFKARRVIARPLVTSGLRGFEHR